MHEVKEKLTTQWSLCIIEVTINTIYATLFIYYPLLEGVLIKPSSGNKHMIL
jgi:hypothetical protein